MRKLYLFCFILLLIFIFSCKKGGISTGNAPSAVTPEDNPITHSTALTSLSLDNYASSTNSDGTYEVVVDYNVDLNKITENDFLIKAENPKSILKILKYDNGARWTVEVVAEDGNTIKTYTVLIKNAPPNLSSEKGINYITIDNVAQNITANPNDEFNFSVDNVDIQTYYNIQPENIKVSLKDSKAIYEVTEITNDINNKRTYQIAVTAENQTKEDRYILTVIRNLSDDANLEFVKTVIGEITPVFDKNITEYSINLLENIDAFNNLSVTNFEKQEAFQYATSVITIGDIIDSPNIKSKVVTFTVTAENGNTKIYTITVSANKSSNTSIASFKLSEFDGKLDPRFNQNIYRYKLEIGKASDTSFNNLVVNVTAVSPYTKVDIVYTNPISKDDKQTRDIIITVTAENGNTKTYTINVIREVKK